MKIQDVLHKEDIIYSERKWVLLKLKQYRQISVANKLHHKLSPRFYVPYQILKKTSFVAYKVSLLLDCLIYNLFHLCMLKKYK